MAKQDPLDLLLRQCRVAGIREAKQIEKEREAAERAIKLARMRDLREAFDAERFRWLLTEKGRAWLSRVGGRIDRALLDVAMSQETPRAKAS